jgi:hypothetical protein
MKAKLVLISFAVFLLSFTGNAQWILTQVNGITYTPYGNAGTPGGQQYSVTGLEYPTNKVVIASYVNGFGVTVIAPGALANQTEVTSVTMPDLVTNVGTEAFYECTGLTNISFGAGVQNLGGYLCYGCTSLANISIPGNVTGIGGYAFANSSLTSLSIPASVTSLGGDIVFDCVNLTNITVDAANPVYSSTNGVLFDKAQDLLIQYPIGLTNATYVIPNSVTSIGEQAFRYGVGLEGIAITNNVTVIGSQAFLGCSNLVSATIGTNVVNIVDDAFWNCVSLANINIPDSVTNIGENVFYNCIDLTNAVIPDSVIGLGEGAFTGAGLQSVTVGNGVPALEFGVFENCTALTSVTLGTNVASIGDYAFFYCTGLTNIVIPDSVTFIGGWAFAYSSLASVTIPASVTYLDDDVFTFKDCANLTNVTFLGDVPYLGDYTEFTDDQIPATVIYYYYGTSGWDTGFGGLPTVMLGAPPPQIGGKGSGAGVQAGQFGFAVNGVANQTVVVEASTDLIDWQPVWTNTLTGSSANFTDPLWTNFPARYYRAH